LTYSALAGVSCTFVCICEAFLSESPLATLLYTLSILIDDCYDYLWFA
jgi:hypothetical protein